MKKRTIGSIAIIMSLAILALEVFFVNIMCVMENWGRLWYYYLSLPPTLLSLIVLVLLFIFGIGMIISSKKDTV